MADGIQDASLARTYLEVGTNPSSREKVEMQAEVNEKASEYTVQEMQRFMQACLHTIVEESPAMIRLQRQAMEQLGKAMQDPDACSR